MKVNKEQKIRAQFEKLRKELDNIETSKRTRENKKLVGKCFKTLNSYGSDSPKWWLYKKIIKGGCYMTSIQFEITSQNIFEYKTDKYCNNLNGWTEINQEEFTHAWLDFTRKLNFEAQKAGIT